MLEKLHVVIGGGTGLIGRALSKSLTSKGHKVTVVSRQGGKPDVISWSELKKLGLPSSTSAVVGLSGAPPFDPIKRWTDDFKKVVYDSHVKPCEYLRDAVLAADKKPKVFVGGSAVGIYPPSLSNIYTEDSATGSDYLAEMSQAWEVAGQITDENVRNVALRIGIVLSKDGGMLANLLPQFKLGVGATVGSGKQYLPWIHISDIVGLIEFAITNEHVNGALNAVAPAPVTYGTFAASMGKVLNRPSIFWVPEFAMNFIMGEERGRHILLGHKVVPKRANDFGYKFKFSDLDSALNDAVK